MYVRELRWKWMTASVVGSAVRYLFVSRRGGRGLLVGGRWRPETKEEGLNVCRLSVCLAVL